jgi:hypothetical protein
VGNARATKSTGAIAFGSERPVVRWHMTPRSPARGRHAGAVSPGRWLNIEALRTGLLLQSFQADEVVNISGSPDQDQRWVGGFSVERRPE